MSAIANAPDLQRGSSTAENTPWVQYLQQLLAYFRAYSGPIDGTFDEDVEAAVKKIQGGMRDYAAGQGQTPAPVDGVVTKPVWEWLYGGASTGEALDSMAGSQIVDYRVEENEEEGDDGRRVAWNKLASERDKKLAPGAEIGRQNWVAGSLQCTIRDWKGDTYTGPVYVVFEGTDTRQSDEGDRATNGNVTFANIWMPTQGQLRVLIESYDAAGNDMYAEGHLPGQFDLGNGDPHMGIDVVQEADKKEVTVTEAEEHGWVRGLGGPGGPGLQGDRGARRAQLGTFRVPTANPSPVHQVGASRRRSRSAWPPAGSRSSAPTSRPLAWRAHCAGKGGVHHPRIVGTAGPRPGERGGRVAAPRPALSRRLPWHPTQHPLAGELAAGRAHPIASTRAGTDLCHGVPAHGSRSSLAVNSLGAIPVTIRRPSST